MALSTRSRFILISVSIAVLSLILFTSVIYDRAIQYKHEQEISIAHVFADQLIQSITKIKSVNSVRQALAENIALEYQNAKLFVILDEARNPDHFFENKDVKSTAFNALLSELKNNNLNEGFFSKEDKAYHWFIKDLPSFRNDNKKLLIVTPLSSSVVSDFIKFFGLPFFISGFILCWVMVWASIILSSLVNKLEKQKNALGDQALDIEKARDDALLANSAKSNFLANMSHEIRTPLTSIIGFAESCLDIDQSMAQRSTATKTIIKSGKHLMHIINEILDLSKIEAGKLEIEKLPISVTELLHEVKQIVSLMAEEKGLIFGINNNYPLPEKFNSDPLRLKQILLNLCSNAIKFTSTGHVYLNVTYESEASNLTFEVIDTGIGMSAEETEKIFIPFEQADSSTTRKFGGTGLGLTLSKQLAEKLNGTLEVESTINKGSRFTVKLKIDEAANSSYIYQDAEINNSEKLNYENSEPPKLSGKILVAEDNEDIQELVKLLLKKIGLVPDMVKNGKLAVEKALKSEYDLVFLDIQMPVMDGLSAMKVLKKKAYAKPVIAMTANAMQADRDECIASGFTGFVSKPIDRSDLYDALIKHLKPSKTLKGNQVALTSNLLQKDPELIDLIDKFMIRLPIMQDAINKAHEDKNEEEFSGLIHQLKGVGGGYGYPMLTELCAKLEFQITSKKTENVNALIEEFNLMVEEVMAGSEENHRIANS